MRFFMRASYFVYGQNSTPLLPDEFVNAQDGEQQLAPLAPREGILPVMVAQEIHAHPQAGSRPVHVYQLIVLLLYRRREPGPGDGFDRL